jgi:ribosomal protein S12 methylthiotransferase accessory factor
LHGLLEHAERDAFQLGWHRRRPLPEIDHASLTTPVARDLLAFAQARGFRVHLLVTTFDLQVPSVWGLAVRTDGGWPASVSAAGAHPDPERAVLAALWELIQLVGYGLDVSRRAVEKLVGDPWLVVDLEDHLRRYASPALLDRVSEVLGGRRVALAEAFPGWPGSFRRRAGGDVNRALGAVADLYAAAGLGEIIVVDGSTRDHLDLGLRAVRVIVPGIVPLCFGQAQQRYAGVPRFAAAIEDARGFALADDELPLDPHPFP